jgi:cytoskeletal protein RodZ
LEYYYLKNMQINRHNYEEFFLLYVDKELSAAERKAVDVFVKENPDLQMELFLLQQTVVKADDIVLDKKDWLYMEEDISALQENLLLYTDDELMPADKRSVEFLLANDKAAQAEWNILQQTKLQPDMAVVFADKQSLYRKEGGRVVGFKWWRVAAAAILLGFGLWTGVSVYKNNFKATTGTGELTGNKTQPKQIKTEIPENITTVPEEKSATDNMVSTSDQKNNTAKASENIKPAVEKTNNKNTVAPKESIAVQNSSNKKPDNNLPKSYLDNINKNGSNETIVTNVIPENNSNRVSGNNNAVVRTNPNEKINKIVVPDLNKINTADPTATAAIQVVNKNPDENNNNRYLDVDDDKEKRTALGGFLRKAKRVLERNTNVKTGDGIKIAGFEIALK